MMLWDIIENILKVLVVRKMTANRAIGLQWLKALRTCRGGLRLAICMAIDIKSGALDPGVFAKILEEIDLHKYRMNPRLAFAAVLRESSKASSFIAASKFTAPLLSSSEVYVRILELGSFIQYYTHPIYAHSIDPADTEEVRRMFFKGDFDSSLVDLNKPWSGRKGIVWVASMDDLTALMDRAPSGLEGSIVNDAFGLGMNRGLGPDGKAELVAVRYPLGFSMTCIQPTVLDARWEAQSGFYISFKDHDRWGRTHSCSGDNPSSRERIHHKINTLTLDYHPVYIGIAHVPKKDSKSLLKEAVKRLKEA